MQKTLPPPLKCFVLQLDNFQPWEDTDFNIIPQWTAGMAEFKPPHLQQARGRSSVRGWFSSLPPCFLKEGVHCYIRFEEILQEKISQNPPGELNSPTEKAAFYLGCKEHKPAKRLGVKGGSNKAWFLISISNMLVSKINMQQHKYSKREKTPCTVCQQRDRSLRTGSPWRAKTRTARISDHKTDGLLGKLH